MTQKFRLFMVLLGAMITIASMIVVSQNTTTEVSITAPSFIRVGDDLYVTVAIEGAQAGETVDITLMNGLNFIDGELILGTGGIAIWSIEPNVITQAGTGSIVVNYDGVSVTRRLRVLPEQITNMEVFASANNIEAYSQGKTTIMVLPEDKWGNTPSNTGSYDIDITFPDTSHLNDRFIVKHGIGLYTLTSQSNPGRVRVTVSSDNVSANMELMQTASAPATLNITVQPPCVLNDARDIISVSVEANDNQGQIVSDGTLLSISWNDGVGFAQTIDGVATLRLPAFPDIGTYEFVAHSGNVSSSEAQLIVVEDTCLE